MRHLPLLLTACLASFVSAVSAAPQVPVTEAWGDLLRSPPFRAGQAWVRLGVQAKEGAPGSPVLVYALFEGPTRPGSTQAQSGSQLGPLEVVPVRELCRLSKRLEQLERLDRLPSDALHVLYATELLVPDRGSARFEIKAGREVVARLTLRAKGRDSNPWFVVRGPREAKDTLEAAGAPEELRVSAAQALPRWPGDEPLLWETPQRLIPLSRLLPQATPRQPTLGVRLLPEGVLELSHEGGLGNLVEHLLARVWIRGRPIALLRKQVEGETRGGLLGKLERRTRVRLDLDLESLGAKEGDRVELQLLYSPRGVRYPSKAREALRALCSGSPAISRRLVIREGRVEALEGVLEHAGSWKRTGGHPCVRLRGD